MSPFFLIYSDCDDLCRNRVASIEYRWSRPFFSNGSTRDSPLADPAQRPNDRHTAMQGSPIWAKGHEVAAAGPHPEGPEPAGKPTFRSSPAMTPKRRFRPFTDRNETAGVEPVGTFAAIFVLYSSWNSPSAATHLFERGLCDGSRGSASARRRNRPLKAPLVRRSRSSCVRRLESGALSWLLA